MVRFAIPFCILAAAPTLAAAEFRAEKEGDRLFLAADTCAETMADARALSQWTNSTNPEKKCDGQASIAPPSTIPAALRGSECVVDVTNCVPDHVLKYHGAQVVRDGPNCWNLALVMAGILPSLRYSTPEEMTFYMRPPLCRQLKNGETRKPGDIGALRARHPRTKAWKEAHGFIYISDQLAYSKQLFRQEPYRLMPPYFLPPDRGSGEFCHGNEVPENAHCDVATSYFRCISMSEYLRKNPGVPEEIKAAMAGVNKFEQCLEKYSVGGAPLSPIARTNIREATQALVSYLQSERSKSDLKSMPDEKQNFLIASLQLRLKAISELLSSPDYVDKTDQELARLAVWLKNSALSVKQ